MRKAFAYVSSGVREHLSFQRQGHRIIIVGAVEKALGSGSHNRGCKLVGCPRYLAGDTWLLILRIRRRKHLDDAPYTHTTKIIRAPGKGAN